MENDSHIVFVEDDTCIKTYDTQDETIYLDLGLLQKVIETESSDLMGKIGNLLKTLEEQKSVKQQLVEEKSKAQAEFEEPVITPIMELAPRSSSHIFGHKTVPPLVPPTSKMKLSNKIMEKKLDTDQYCDAVPPSQPGTLQGLRSPLVKRISLWGYKPGLQQQLRIDTRQDHVNTKSMYNPQLEVISPTWFLDSILDDPNFRAIKDDLLRKISKVDQEIAVAENTILKLRKKEQELACQPDEKKDEEEESLAYHPMKYQSLAQNIYTENRRKAQKAHLEMEKMGPKVEFPLYNQPSDTVVYYENKRKHISLKKRLLEHLSNKNNKNKAREEYLVQTYSKLVQEWHQKVYKIKNSVEKKAEDAKHREFFEKEFPELRRQREDRERSREGVMVTRSRTRANVQETVNRVQEQEMINKLRLRAVIPPLLLGAEQRRHCYISNNQKIEDLYAEYKEQKVLNMWTKGEKEIFKEKFLKHSKDFGVIASYFNCKSACDCVQFYYHNKKKENYKQLLRQQKLKQRHQQEDIYPKG